MFRAPPLVIGIAAALISGCSRAPSEKEVVGEMVSWMGTADLASQSWLNHTTFDRYTRATLELSAKMLAEQSGQLTLAAPRHDAAIDSAVTLARESMIRIAALVTAKDAPGARSQLDSLRAAKKVVVALSESLPRSP